MIVVFHREIVELITMQTLIHRIMNITPAVDHVKQDTVTWHQSKHQLIKMRNLNYLPSKCIWLKSLFFLCQQTLERWTATISKPTDCAAIIGIWTATTLLLSRRSIWGLNFICQWEQQPKRNQLFLLQLIFFLCLCQNNKIESITLPHLWRVGARWRYR